MTKSVTKSRLHCTRITFFKSAISYILTQTTGEIRMRYILRFVLALSFLMKSYNSVTTPKKALSFLMKSYHSVTTPKANYHANVEMQFLTKSASLQKWMHVKRIWLDLCLDHLVQASHTPENYDAHMLISIPIIQYYRPKPQILLFK